MPVAILTGQAEIHWSAIAIGSMLFHVFLMCVFSLIMWFWLLRNYLANGIGVFSFLTPIFGMIFGVVFLNEHIELNFILGTALVMLGVMTVSLHHWIAQKIAMNV
ncbi:MULTISPECIES: DMT family transporter [Acinetobacter]|uniref:DMT family transporter n=1 Tax=Acinetobacter TaxID=469 RepID=UPI0009D664DD|nr:DMT family transporter [Acinetobacter sp. HR7]